MKKIPKNRLEITPEFKHPEFPILLVYLDNKDQKDIKDVKYCYFSCQDHVKKYVQRYKIKKNDCKIYIMQ